MKRISSGFSAIKYFATCTNRLVLKLFKSYIDAHQSFATCTNRRGLKLILSLFEERNSFAICTNRRDLKPHDTSRPAWQCCLSVSQNLFAS
mgnify:CR=1 FL=1